MANLIDSMIASREFGEIRRRSQPAELLEAFYEGLLLRAPDSASAGGYLRVVSRGAYQDVIMSLVESSEFESSLTRVRRRR